MRIRAIALTLLLITAQAAPTVSWQKHGAVLSGQKALALLRLCYRPELKVSAQWMPSSEQIVHLEMKLKASFGASKSFPK
jgi:hypothetical protein